METKSELHNYMYMCRSQVVPYSGNLSRENFHELFKKMRFRRETFVDC